MAKYFIDFEFSEYFITKGLFKKKEYHVIEPISLGIKCDDGRELEILYNDFDIDHAWNKYDLKEANTAKNHSQYDIKEYWLRDNVLKSIALDYFKKETQFGQTHFPNMYEGLKGFKNLVKQKGVSRKETAKQIKEFCQALEPDGFLCFEKRSAPEFYGYFADYDWICMCQTFGRMLDLPRSVGFPMYCNDLVQMMNEWVIGNEDMIKDYDKELRTDKFYSVKDLKKHGGYPKQENEHLAIDDARWNERLYNFLIKLK